MSSSEDSNEYECYELGWYEEGEGPPLIKTRSRILAYVVQNDVEGLRLILDSPKWYKVKDKYGYNILQIAILRESKKVFDYLMSLEDFPVDAPSRTGETALVIALTGFVSNDICISDYYAYKLLQRDVKIDAICLDGNTLLHCAFERNSVRAAKLLIEKGADVNALNDEGDTPLTMCLFYCDPEDMVEGVFMLLCYGADPLISSPNGNSPFEIIMMITNNKVLAQTLFDYVFDQYTHLNIGIGVLLEAAQNKWPLFCEALDKFSEVYCDSSASTNALRLFTMNTKYLKVLIDKFDSAVEEVLVAFLENPILYSYYYTISIKNLDMLINSRFKSYIIEIICNANSSDFISSLIRKQMDLSTLSEIVCYLLSYGMIVDERSFKIIYDQFGYCELFKVLLHMDITRQGGAEEKPEIIPALFYNMRLDIDTYLQEHCQTCDVSVVKNLLSHTANPKLKQRCYELDDNAIFEKVNRLPDIPLLVELARNAFRKYFIEKLNITTSKQFYTLLKGLPISDVYKKIVTFEMKLYE